MLTTRGNAGRRRDAQTREAPGGPGRDNIELHFFSSASISFKYSFDTNCCSVQGLGFLGPGFRFQIFGF